MSRLWGSRAVRRVVEPPGWTWTPQVPAAKRNRFPCQRTSLPCGRCSAAGGRRPRAAATLGGAASPLATAVPYASAFCPALQRAQTRVRVDRLGPCPAGCASLPTFRGLSGAEGQTAPKVISGVPGRPSEVVQIGSRPPKRSVPALRSASNTGCVHVAAMPATRSRQVHPAWRAMRAALRGLLGVVQQLHARRGVELDRLAARACPHTDTDTGGGQSLEHL